MQIRSALAGAGDPVRAEGQQRYMKSAMPYRGLTSPELKGLLGDRLGPARLREDGPGLGLGPGRPAR